jgi:N-acetylmuramoyl-L-alanine amidase
MVCPSITVDAKQPVKETSTQKVIVIDPGCQMNANNRKEPIGPGAFKTTARATTGVDGAETGIHEYELNLQIALLLKDILEQRGYQVVLTRTNNQTAISNMQRAQMAAAEGAEIFVRIHANSSGDHSASGALTLSPSQESPYVSHLFPESQRLSRCVLDGYCAATGLADLGILYDDTMTGINWSQVPVTIIEMGFMSNEHDDTMMNDPAFRKTMAAGIADGIDLYFSGAANGTSAAN